MCIWINSKQDQTVHKQRKPKCSQIIPKYVKTTFEVKQMNVRDVPKTGEINKDRKQ